MKRFRRRLFSGTAAVSLTLAAALIIAAAALKANIGIRAFGITPLSPHFIYEHWTILYEHYHQLRLDFFKFQGNGAIGFATPARTRQIRFPGFQWRAQWQQDPSNPQLWALYSNTVSINAWLLIPLLFILPASWLALRIRRPLLKADSKTTCPACGYDLRATPDRCPECGTVIRPKVQS